MVHLIKYASSLLCILLLCMLPGGMLLPAGIGLPEGLLAAEVALTEEERNWIQGHPTIRVANETDWPPFDFAQEGVEKGYAIDLVKLAAKKSGLALTFINGYTWKTLLQMGRERKIDLFPAIWKNTERQNYLTFTKPYIDTPHIIVVVEKERRIHRIQDLQKRILAGVKGYASTDLVLNHFPEIKLLEVPSPVEGLRKVAYGQADAYLGTLGSTIYEIRQKMIHGLKVAGETDLGGHIKVEHLHMATRNDWPLLHGIIQKGLDAISVEERMALPGRWIALPGPDARQQLPLSVQQKAWLRDHGTLRFRTRPRAPLAIVEGTELAGILGD